jgi:ketosteroid isomerase-like protein
LQAGSWGTGLPVTVRVVTQRVDDARLGGVAVARLEVVGRLFELFERGEFEPAMELLAEDFVAVIPPSMSAEPDVYEGHAGARRYFEGFEGLVEDVHFEALEIIEEGEVVMVPLRLHGRGVASGIEAAQDGVAVIWVEDGLIARIEVYPDLDAAREALRRGSRR